MNVPSLVPNDSAPPKQSAVVAPVVQIKPTSSSAANAHSDNNNENGSTQTGVNAQGVNSNSNAPMPVTWKEKMKLKWQNCNFWIKCYIISHFGFDLLFDFILLICTIEYMNNNSVINCEDPTDFNTLWYVCVISWICDILLDYLLFYISHHIDINSMVLDDTDTLKGLMYISFAPVAVSQACINSIILLIGIYNDNTAYDAFEEYWNEYNTDDEIPIPTKYIFFGANNIVILRLWKFLIYIFYMFVLSNWLVDKANKRRQNDGTNCVCGQACIDDINVAFCSNICNYLKKQNANVSGCGLCLFVISAFGILAAVWLAAAMPGVLDITFDCVIV